MTHVWRLAFGVWLLILSPIIFGNAAVNHQNKFASFLWGEFVDNNIQVGTFYTHYPKKKSDPRYRPYIGLTYQSINLTYFKNCSYNDSFGISIQRNLKGYSFNDHKLSIGYRAGAAYGWCYTGHWFATKSSPACHGKVPVIPFIALITSYKYKNAGIELDILGDVINLNLLYFF